MDELQLFAVILAETCSAGAGTSSGDIDTDLAAGLQGGLVYTVSTTASGSEGETFNGNATARTIFEFRLSGAAPYRFTGTATGTTGGAWLGAGTGGSGPWEFGCVFSPEDTVGFANPCVESLPAGGPDESGVLPAGIYQLVVTGNGTKNFAPGTATVELRLGAAALE